MMAVFLRYRLAARPATSRHTPPPMAMMGSERLWAAAAAAAAAAQRMRENVTQ
jgi:hypothetical protein